MLKESENWGIVELIWGKNFSSRQNNGVVKLIEYNPFCPYIVDLDYYKNARNSFTIEEWIDVLVSAADYNPSGYDSEEQSSTSCAACCHSLKKSEPDGTGP